MAKIGRNQPCPCNSGKKFKHCHGGLDAPPVLDPRIQQAMMQAIQNQQAQELVRTAQQGHGRPILSAEMNGQRVVFVGKQVLSRPVANWRFFNDFLIDFLKDKMNLAWGKRESEKATDFHPIIRWLRKLQAQHDATPVSGGAKLMNKMGFSSALSHLGYALYLIQHHDEIPKKLLERLRDIRTFLPAYYEALAGAAFAVAGFSLKCLETKKSAESVAEFEVTSKQSGKRYLVEAKRKDGWPIKTDDLASEEFKKELERFVRGRLHAASKKKLQNAIYWIELSIPTLRQPDEWI